MNDDNEFILKKVQAETFKRDFRVETKGIDEEARTVELAFSSEDPYQRWFGYEILGHKPDEVRLDRLRNGAALLVNHDIYDQVGVIESARIDIDGKGRAIVRFGKSARASEVFQDVIDGIRRLVSVGYRVHQMLLDSTPGDDEDAYRVTDWEPHEISIVSVPADTTVGVGRSIAEPAESRQCSTQEDNSMSELIENGGTVEIAVDYEAERKAAREAELKRVRNLQSLGEQFHQADLAREMINSGASVDEFIAQAATANEAARRQSASDIGLTERETKGFSVCRLALAIAFPSSREYQRAAAFELEACAAAVEAQTRAGIQVVNGQVLPPEVMRDDFSEGLRFAARSGAMRPHHAQMLRTLTAGTATDGAELVATDLLAANFIDVLRNQLVVARAGCTMLNGLQGDVAIPRKTSGASGGWIGAEGGNAANSEAQFDQVTMTPKTVAAYTDYSRQLLLQSSIGVEAMVRMDLAAGIATTADLAGLYGSGSSGQPTGIANTSGINAPTDFAAADPTYAEVVAMETAVADDNADVGSLAYITDPAMRGAFKTTEKATGTAQFIWEPGNMVNGYMCHVTKQVTDGDLFFGNFAELICGTWGGLDLLADPYTGSLAGTVRLVAHQSIDFAVRHPVSFAFNNDGA